MYRYERTYPIVNGTIIKTNVNNFNNYTATENVPMYNYGLELPLHQVVAWQVVLLAQDVIYKSQQM